MWDLVLQLWDGTELPALGVQSLNWESSLLLNYLWKSSFISSLPSYDAVVWFTAFCCSIHKLMDIWLVFSSLQLWIMLYKHSCRERNFWELWFNLDSDKETVVWRGGSRAQRNTARTGNPVYWPLPAFHHTVWEEQWQNACHLHLFLLGYFKYLAVLAGL